MLPWISLGAGSQSEPDEESRGHNVAAQVLRFTETGTADPSFANPTFHYSGTGGSGIEALVHRFEDSSICQERAQTCKALE
jgi:hypothetical protein